MSRSSHLESHSRPEFSIPILDFSGPSRLKREIDKLAALKSDATELSKQGVLVSLLNLGRRLELVPRFMFQFLDNHFLREHSLKVFHSLNKRGRQFLPSSLNQHKIRKLFKRPNASCAAVH